VALGLGAGAALPDLQSTLVACVVGFLGYGVSLALFVLALRHLGTARTGAYFSTAPFLGAVVAVVGLGDPVTIRLFVAGGLMAIGVWLHLTEEHEHEVLAHAHPHLHDAHHQHEHGPDDPLGEPHTHAHRHGGLRHRHGHLPDVHHQHHH
jgi:hypothetical protein